MMSETINASIIIPTHNRSRLLKWTLESLASMQVPDHVDAEVLVILNGCTDDSREVAEACLASVPTAWRVIDEPTLGVSHARNRAVAESRGDVLCFLDDDVKVEPDWLGRIIDTANRNEADVVGGGVELWWEDVERPDWFTERFNSFLSGCKHGEEPHPIRSSIGAIGANCLFRRKVFETNGGFIVNLDRIGGSLLGGSDTEIVDRAIEAGFKAYHDPTAIVHHWVFAKGITADYFRRVSHGNAYSRVMLKGKVSPVQFLRSFAGHAWLLVTGSCKRITGRLSSNETKRRDGMIKQYVGVGGLHAWINRLLGKKPSKATPRPLDEPSTSSTQPAS